MVARHSGKSRPRRRATFSGVIGELLLTAGVIVAGFVGWQYFLSDAMFGAQQQEAASVFAASITATDTVSESELRTDAPPAETAAAMHESYAVMYIPRFGDFQRIIGEGTERLVLDNPEQGIGRYPDSALPGEEGNMAVAAHRSGAGAPFNALPHLQVGDRIYIQTSEAWYVYEFRNNQYVPPTQVSVIAPVPDMPHVHADGAYLTLTTCNPEWSADGRLISFAVLQGWIPSGEGMPAELAEHLAGIA